MRRLPNIIITGTPGVGKTTTAEQLVSVSSSGGTSTGPLKLLSINELAKSRSCYESYDATLQTHIVDEDKLLDEVEKEIDDGGGEGGWVMDWHACDLFPERWIDLVVVLRCEDTRVLFDRMTERGYPEEKVQENMDAEIFGVIAEEAREGFAEGSVVELNSERVEQVEENCERVLKWVETWVADRKRQAEQAD